MAKKKNIHFEVDLKTRLEQSRASTNAVRLPELGYAPYRVYKIKESKGVSKGILNGMHGSVGTGKSSYNMTVLKSRQFHQVIWDYVDLIEALSPQQYKVQWLKPKQATLLRLKGHRVELTTADDRSTIGPVRIGL